LPPSYHVRHTAGYSAHAGVEFRPTTECQPVTLGFGYTQQSGHIDRRHQFALAAPALLSVCRQRSPLTRALAVATSQALSRFIEPILLNGRHKGLRWLVRAAPPYPICTGRCFASPGANRPLPAGERWNRTRGDLIQSKFISLVAIQRPPRRSHKQSARVIGHNRSALTRNLNERSVVVHTTALARVDCLSGQPE